VQQAAERAQNSEEAAATDASVAASVAEDIATLTSRTLLRSFKALMMLALLATAGVGAGMAFKLGTTHGARASSSLVRMLTRLRRARRRDARVQAAVRRLRAAAPRRLPVQPQQPGAQAQGKVLRKP
jgi:hypothetical protein